MKRTKDSAISRFIANRDPVSYAQTSTKMNIAVLIDDARIEKGWDKGELAKQFNRPTSTINRWLSGTCNFTIETLVEISLVLDIKLVAMYEEKDEKN